MPSIVINAPPDKVFEAMCDLTRHAKWAPDNITIEAGQEGLPEVGHTYTSSLKGKTPDQLTITGITPNESLRFHSVLPNKWEFDFEMTMSPQGEGNLVSRSARITKIPLVMSPMRLVVAVAGPMLDKKLLKGMKADLESSS